MARVQIYCRAYNVKPYLKQCISSVLSQTYSDFELFLIDNGCTDGSSEIIDAFAAADSRIRVIRFGKNTRVVDSLYNVIRETMGGYIAILDSDDWWAPYYLEKLLNFAQRYSLDIACTGAVMENQDTGTQVIRDLERPLFLRRQEFAAFFPVYHAFFRTYWGKLFRTEVLAQQDFERFAGYGGDTLYAFEALRNSKQMGIDRGALYHYRVRSGSVSYKYSPRRFLTDVNLYNDALRFLGEFGPLSAENRRFLREVFGNAVLDSVRVLIQAKIPPEEKAAELRKIAGHPFTIDAYRNEERTAQSHDEVVFHALKTAQSLDRRDFEDMGAALTTLLPHCGRCVTADTLPLFYAEAVLMGALVQDDRDALASGVLSFIRKRQYTKQYDLGSTLQALAMDIPLLRGIKSTVFIRSYADIYWLVWQGHTAEALDEMTGLLLENRVHSGKEIFLQLYLNLAAQSEEISAFIYGNIRMAEFCLRQGQTDACRKILMDLKEMGVEENAEIEHLWRDINACSLPLE